MITVDKNSGTPLYQQLFASCREEIISGRIQAGSKLPALRKLASELDVSRNTVEGAYRQLLLEGYVVSRPGGGYIVEKLNLDEIALADSKKREATGHAETISAKPAFEEMRFDFTYGNLEDNAFPANIWRKLTCDALFGAEGADANRYGEPQGDPQLRQELSKRLAASRGVHCTSEQIVILPGTQTALMKLLMLFDSTHDIVAMENPGFDGARIVFERQGFTTVPFDVDECGGWDLAALERSKAKLAFVTPSSQFPMSKIMTLSKRQRILAWACKTDAYIIEDDYCREFRYNAQPLPSLQSLDLHERVIYMGTFSKALSPALRMNYLVLPNHLMERWRKTFDEFRNEVPWLSQTVLRLFMQQGHWDRMLKRVQTRHKRKHFALVSALKASFGERVRIIEGNAGLHLLVETNDGRNADELVREAAAEGVRVYSTERYWMEGSDDANRFVLIGFSHIEENDIASGVEALARAWFPKET